MALKRLKVKLTTPPVENGEIPVIRVEGNNVGKYNRASAQKNAAEQTMKELRPDLLIKGLSEVFTRSIDKPLTPTLTVKLQDVEGEVLRVEFTKAYGAVDDVATAETLFQERDVDVNDYLQEKVVAKFNDKVFLDENGNFQQAVYIEFRKAIEQVSKRLGVACPLETEKVVSVKDSFHVERFVQFPSLEDQKSLTACLPNTTRIVPVTVNKV